MSERSRPDGRGSAAAPPAVALPSGRDRDATVLGLVWAGVGALVLAMAYAVPWTRLGLVTCAFRRWTGLPCPTCGMTRAFHAMARGGWREAVETNPLGSVLFLAVAGLAAWNGGILVAGRRMGVALRPWPRKIGPRALILAATALAANWIYLLMTVKR